MSSYQEMIDWNEYQIILKQKYPQLTNSDIIWRYSSKDDLLQTIAQKLGMSKNGLIEAITISL